MKIARALAVIFLDPFRGAQPRTREAHDESPTPADDLRGTSTANPALRGPGDAHFLWRHGQRVPGPHFAAAAVIAIFDPQSANPAGGPATLTKGFQPDSQKRILGTRG